MKPSRTKQMCWFSHSPHCSFNLKLLFTLLNFSDLGADYWYVNKNIRMAKFGNEGSFSAKAKGTLLTCATMFIDSVDATFA